MSLLSYNLQAFESIASTGAVHRAAEKLGLSQTGVTQRLRALERELRVTLFTRSRKGMRLTSEGEALLQYCRGSNELEGSVLSQISGAQIHAASLTLVGPTSAMTSRFVPSCLSVYKEWPNLSLNFQMEDHRDRIAMLRTGEADLAVVAPHEVPKEMDSKMLRPDRYVLACTSKWKGRKLEEIIENERIIDFYEQDQTTLKYLKHFGYDSISRRARLFINSNEALMTSVIAGVGYGTFTKETSAAKILSGELFELNRGQMMPDDLALAWYPRPQMPKYLKSIISKIK